MDRYYVNKSEKQETFLEEVEYVTSTEERESIFCDHRNDLHHKLVNSVNIYSAVPRFFDSLCHAENQFMWLTNKDIAKHIETELPHQFKIVECVTKEMCTTKEFRLNLEMAKLKG